MASKLKKKDRQELYAHASKFFVDIAKLVFAGVILADILKQDVDFWWMLGGGLAALCGLLSLAYYLFVISKKE